jgi:hypothetical protein
MRLSKNIRRFSQWSVLLILCSVVVACGDNARQEASGGPQVSPAQSNAEDGRTNRAPEITAIRFEPPRAIPGKPLTARVGSTDPDRDTVELGYTWKVNGRRAPSSSSVFEIPSNLSSGDRIEVSVVATDGTANSAASVQMIVIGNRRPSVQDIQIQIQRDETGKMSHWLADPSAQDPDGDDLSFRYSWIVNGTEIGEETAELERAPRKRGDEIRLIVWATDGEDESAPLKSAPFSITNSPPDIHSRPPALDPSGRFAYSVKASDRDGDRSLRYSVNQGPAGMTIDAFSGELLWQATAQNAGEHIVEIAVDDRHGGTTNQTFYVQVSAGPASKR